MRLIPISFQVPEAKRLAGASSGTTGEGGELLASSKVIVGQFLPSGCSVVLELCGVGVVASGGGWVDSATVGLDFFVSDVSDLEKPQPADVVVAANKTNTTTSMDSLLIDILPLTSPWFLTIVIIHRGPSVYYSR